MVIFHIYVSLPEGRPYSSRFTRSRLPLLCLCKVSQMSQRFLGHGDFLMQIAVAWCFGLGLGLMCGILIERSFVWIAHCHQITDSKIVKRKMTWNVKRGAKGLALVLDGDEGDITEDNGIQLYKQFERLFGLDTWQSILPQMSAILIGSMMIVPRGTQFADPWQLWKPTGQVQ